MAVEPRPGVRVLTADGEQLGTVKLVDEEAFLIDVPGEPDYWLPRREIGDADDDVVRMTFPQEALEDHRIRYGTWET